jgi:hypothetical protein
MDCNVASSSCQPLHLLHISNLFTFKNDQMYDIIRLKELN